MSKTIIHKSEDRGFADHGWLKARHSFSFADYYDNDRIRFGLLRVLNDDQIAPGMGFGTHPHNNMEIVTIPLEGELEHRDSMGNIQVLRTGEIQVMSAGSGIQHSEYNHSKDKFCRLLQIWVFPDTKNVKPRYNEFFYDTDKHKNELIQLVSPDKEDAGSWVHQKAWFNIGKFDKEKQLNYDIKYNGNGVYAFVIEGEFEIDGNKLNRRDAVGISETEKITIKALAENSLLLIIDVPMEL